MASKVPEFQLTNDQKRASDVLNGTFDNVFLTGAAGTGKSELVRRFIRKNYNVVDVVASTGSAAMLLGGTTFHSFFGIGLCIGELQDIVAKALFSGKVRGRLMRCSTLIIDEVSMLPGYALEVAEHVARQARGSDLPWGGIRIIAVGDFAQLAPVSENGVPDWAFLHPVWEWSNFTVVCLNEVVRTREADYIKVLNHIRRGELNEFVYSFLSSRPTPPAKWEGTRLYPRRAEAEAYNMDKLGLITEELFQIPSIFGGDSRYFNALRKSMPVPETLYLKKGALVMMLKNDSIFGAYCNGSLGTVVDVGEFGDAVVVKLLSGEVVTVGQVSFGYHDAKGKVLATVTNFPIKLAWASTIHKAQGISVDRIAVKLSNLWEAGQAYVALSRARSLDGLFIDNWDPGSIKADRNVMEFYRRIQG